MYTVTPNRTKLGGKEELLNDLFAQSIIKCPSRVTKKKNVGTSLFTVLEAESMGYLLHMAQCSRGCGGGQFLLKSTWPTFD